MHSNQVFMRLDDYGLVTYLSLLGHEVRCVTKVFEVKIEIKSLDILMSKYKESDYKRFDDVSKKLKKMLKTSTLA